MMEFTFSQEKLHILDQYRWRYLLIATPKAGSCNKFVKRTHTMDLKESCPSVSIPSSDEHREKKKRFTVSMQECKHCRQTYRLSVPRSAIFCFLLVGWLGIIFNRFMKICSLALVSTGHSPVWEVVNVLQCLTVVFSSKRIWLYKFLVFLPPNTSIFSYKVHKYPNAGITFWYQIRIRFGILHDFSWKHLLCKGIKCDFDWVFLSVFWVLVFFFNGYFFHRYPIIYIFVCKRKKKSNFWKTFFLSSFLFSDSNAYDFFPILFPFPLLVIPLPLPFLASQFDLLFCGETLCIAYWKIK